MTELERLLAIEEIKRLVARRVRALDARDWETYQACHAPEHVSDFFKDAGDRDAMMAALRAETAGVTSIHHVYSPDIAIRSDEIASGSWTMEDRRYWLQDGDEHWLHGWGFYHETYACRDGAWLITSRRLERTRVEHSPGSKRASST
ncbi:nuclear transport factor 2 family protein [uncultured Sphingomonas sp.]|uniref:nuclear transport factor 2 family protein n=1 Tax=uncultured Sphingomonas sp. TaxID=158754 RepID=UPI0035CBFC6B